VKITVLIKLMEMMRLLYNLKKLSHCVRIPLRPCKQLIPQHMD